MNNYTNIYDIDGNIIRKAGDNHKFTIDEVEKLVDELTEKVRQNPDNETYKVYLNNANKWLYSMYNSMSKEDVLSRISSLQNNLEDAKKEATDAEQQQMERVNELIEEFKSQYDKEEPDSPSISDENKEVVMDEYVEPIEEIKE